MNRIQLSQLAVLATVAETSSFRKAAEELGIAPSAVSHAVSALEASLGVRLLARTTRSVAPTEEGRQLLQKLAPALADIGTALETLAENKSNPAGPLRITMPALAAEDLIVPRLGDFLGLYPDIQLELITNDQFEDIVEKGFDAGLRLGEHLETDMVAVKASGPISGTIIGAPSYFERHPLPVHPHDLMEHRCIRRRFSSGRIYRWELEKHGKQIAVDVPDVLTLADQRLIRLAALKGVGLAFVFDQRVDKDIREGRLIRVLEDWCPPFDGFYIYYPTRRQMRPALRAFVDFFRHRS
ncbi:MULTISPECIES: LysR family transcriptional regulator [Rhizobium/Agrobacterium group]|uniref:HTH-type transcriptional regulator TtuA n=2 Tax=Rhizobium/Agrobacterium group TaxID=227290 RepID=B9JYJ2_ALLAM|nr:MULTISPECIES: LysR family transcriptional regulator [Rhizobium/Agrobacterium group]ACM35088.1 transcriptional regulator [Allorhizobium ampelinum S4]MCF1447356.1 LysR family transcriptional regulator [Allorhizobium ampelinum]MCF1495589.1 LysR family transcriptional regulator [Allorhizobium ampelinum]MUO27870.1 LysR family transcriptional regulator [Agrobacterium vitis]MUO41094.1 LysR family transcriptional regulator [Agrobacterium vitis]